MQGFSLCPSCSFRTAYILHGSLGTWLLTQSVPWENVVCINKMHHSFSADMYNTKYVHICLITPIVMQLLDFYSSYSYLLFCDICRKAQYPRHFVKARAFLCTSSAHEQPSVQFAPEEILWHNSFVSVWILVRSNLKTAQSSHLLQWELECISGL